MSQKELFKQKEIAREKLIAHLGMTKKVKEMWREISLNPNYGEMYRDRLDGIYIVIDTIIEKSPEDWYPSASKIK